MPRLVSAFLSLVLSLMSVNVAMATTRIDLYWKVVSYEISPQQGRYENQAHDVFVLDGNTVSSGNAGGRLGEVFNGNNGDRGGDYKARVTVHGGTIDAEVQLSGYHVSEKVRNNGTSTCSARIIYSHVRGQKYFGQKRKSNGEDMVVTSMEVKDAHCTIVQE